jgi:hypothetical protein
MLRCHCAALQHHGLDLAGSYQCLGGKTGIYDMYGNVWGRCLDTFFLYTAGAVTDPFITGSLDG